MCNQHLLKLYDSLLTKFLTEVKSFIKPLLSKKQESQDIRQPDTKKRNALGSLVGKVYMAPDFDEPLADFEEYM